MTIISKIGNLIRKNYNFFTLFDTKVLRIQKLNPLFLISFLIIFSSLFFISLSFINKKSLDNKKNVEEIAQSSDFTNFTNFIFSKINSPYEEIEYTIKNNDTLERYLKNLK